MEKTKLARIDITDLVLKEGERVLVILSSEAMLRDHSSLHSRYGEKMRTVVTPTLIVSNNTLNDAIEEIPGPDLFVVVVSV